MSWFSLKMKYPISNADPSTRTLRCRPPSRGARSITSTDRRGSLASSQAVHTPEIPPPITAILLLMPCSGHAHAPASTVQAVSPVIRPRPGFENERSILCLERPEKRFHRRVVASSLPCERNPGVFARQRDVRIPGADGPVRQGRQASVINWMGNARPPNCSLRRWTCPDPPRPLAACPPAFLLSGLPTGTPNGPASRR